MQEVNYIVNPTSASEIKEELVIDKKVTDIVSDYSINTFFESNKNQLKLEIYSIQNTLLLSNSNYKRYSELLNAVSAGQSGASQITLSPIDDIIANGYEAGDVNVVYSFLNNPYTDNRSGGNFYIDQISPDRTEIRLFALGLTDEQTKTYTEAFTSKLEQEAYFSEFYVNLSNDTSLVGINITSEEVTKGYSVVIKLMKPLPNTVVSKDQITISEIVSNTIAFNIEADFIEEKESIEYLRGPNFSIPISETSDSPTEYLDYNDLFSYPVTGSNYELHSLLKEKSVNVSITHSDYSNFVHFSSAEERLRNFKYKLDLVNSYRTSLDTATAGTYIGTGISGSKAYYNGLIEGIVDNFDHYDRHLYFNSGSSSWPKSNSTKPYSNYASNTSEATTWFNSQIAVANNYDFSNFDILINTIPNFIREDANNTSYLMFVHMIAHHFDNLWIYSKAVTDKYDSDNRIDFGVSKDIVREVVQSFGINLYDGNENIDNLFSSYVGETYQTGSEDINHIKVITSGSNLAYQQPMAKQSYKQEVYKRIYHNLPLLTKGKGTIRGLRALTACFGIPDSILSIELGAGTKIGSDDYFGYEVNVTGSLNSIRTDATGSYLSESVVSNYTSIEKPSKKYSQDTSEIHVGFNINNQYNDKLRSRTTGSFNIDQYIGDPSLEQSGSYYALNTLASSLMNLTATWDEASGKWNENNAIWNSEQYWEKSPKAFIRLLKFFDNSLFKMIKNFVPARATVATGLIIEPHLMNRSKAKAPKAVAENTIHTASIAIVTASAGDAGSFPVSASTAYTTNYTGTINTPLGSAPRNVTDEAPKYTGEFKGSLTVVTTGELNAGNPYKSAAQPEVLMDLTTLFLSDPIPASCNISLQVTYAGDYFSIFATGSGATTGKVGSSYPASITEATSITVSQNYDDYEFFTLTQTAIYPTTFRGWYKAPTSSSGNLISTDTTLSVYETFEPVYGNNIYAIFN